ncbi:MAG: alpha/beta hydrolase [Fervidobacterium sp.]|uniref:alpha/beta hydrolase n=1 Tax=Fervidobacterium sp. TaxID=1871331 RepID=UPI00404A4B1C
MNKFSSFTSWAVFFLSIPIILFITWVYSPMKALPEVSEYLKSSSTIDVLIDKHIYFIPKTTAPEVGVIIYPGGHVENKAYAPIGYRLSEKGIIAVVLEVPMNFAIFDTEAASDVIMKFPDIKWYVAGHSLGGVAASEFVYKYKDAVAGLILMASYPAKNISKLDFKVLSIYASEDGLATPQKIKEKEPLLPSVTKYVLIDGGNHSQFGYYGFQKGDKQAKIKKEEQMSIIVKSIIEFIEE